MNIQLNIEATVSQGAKTEIIDRLQRAMKREIMDSKVEDRMRLIQTLDKLGLKVFRNPNVDEFDVMVLHESEAQYDADAENEILKDYEIISIDLELFEQLEHEVGKIVLSMVAEGEVRTPKQVIPIDKYVYRVEIIESESGVPTFSRYYDKQEDAYLCAQMQGFMKLNMNSCRGSEERNGLICSVTSIKLN